MNMKQITWYKLKAISLLEEKRYTLTELADKLGVCQRRTQTVLKDLKDNGLSIESCWEGRKKYFWTNTSSDFLPAILSLSEKQALKSALSQNKNLETAIFKLTEYTNMQLYFQSAR